jgi:hypothetical protein
MSPRPIPGGHAVGNGIELCKADARRIIDQSDKMRTIRTADVLATFRKVTCYERVHLGFTTIDAMDVPTEHAIAAHYRVRPKMDAARYSPKVARVRQTLDGPYLSSLLRPKNVSQTLPPRSARSRGVTAKATYAGTRTVLRVHCCS